MDTQTTTYRYLDYYAQAWRTVRCQLLSHNGKTANIRLLAFGPKGRPPGSEMRVHLKSLDWKQIVETTDLSWHAWTDI